MKSSLFAALMKGAVPALAVATCCFAAVALNASSVADVDTTPEAIQSPTLQISKNTHFVHMTESGDIVGRLKTLQADDFSFAQNVKVHFVRNGQAAAVVKPGDAGLFKVSGLEAGRYSVVTAGKDGLAAYAVAVLPFDGQLTELTLDSAAVPSQDFQVVGNVIKSEVYTDLCSQYCGQKTAVPMAPPASPTPDMLPLPAPPAEENLEAANVTTVSFKTRAFQMPEADTVGEAGVVLKQQPVKLTEDGALNGRIHWLTDSAPHQLPAEGAKVSLVQNGEVVQVANTNANGVFTMANLNPGAYSVVATCPSQFGGGCAIDAGACCSAIQCVPQTYVDPCVPQFDAALVGCTDMSYTMDTFCDSTCVVDQVIDGPIVDQGTIIGEGGYVESPVGGGGYYGGGGGGYLGGGGGGGFGGGGGGLGGLGTLLGAGLGVGGYALLDDDDDSGSGAGGGGPQNSPAGF
ncbi:MAG: hypothetical protein AB8G99_13510 [Planctomycetaceae bacterium]